MRGIAHSRIFTARFAAEAYKHSLKQSWGRDVSTRIVQLSGRHYLAECYAVTVTWPWKASLG